VNLRVADCIDESCDNANKYVVIVANDDIRRERYGIQHMFTWMLVLDDTPRWTYLSKFEPQINWNGQEYGCDVRGRTVSDCVTTSDGATLIVINHLSNFDCNMEKNMQIVTTDINDKYRSFYNETHCYTANSILFVISNVTGQIVSFPGYPGISCAWGDFIGGYPNCDCDIIASFCD